MSKKVKAPCRSLALAVFTSKKNIIFSHLSCCSAENYHLSNVGKHFVLFCFVFFLTTFKFWVFFSFMYDSFGVQSYNILYKHSANYENLTHDGGQVFL